MNSAETVKSAAEGQAGVLATGSRFISPGSTSSGGKEDNNELGAAESPPKHQLRFRGLEPSKRYTVSLCTESNSGTFSSVTVAEAEAHAEAPMVRLVSYPAPKLQHTLDEVVRRRLQGGFVGKEDRDTCTSCLLTRKQQAYQNTLPVHLCVERTEAILASLAYWPLPLSLSSSE